MSVQPIHNTSKIFSSIENSDVKDTYLQSTELIKWLVDKGILISDTDAFPSSINVPLKNDKKLKEEWSQILVETGDFPTSKEATFYASKNRYSNNHPYEENRYRFQNAAIKERCPYMNASSFPSGHILTQGPLPETVEDFWLMVIDAKSPVIVMVANCVENGSDKCHPYWASHLKTVKLQFSGESSLEFNSQVIKRGYSLSFGNSSQDVTQFHVRDWQDHHPYDAAKLFALIEEIEKHLANNATHAPMIVHCSAGLGRSGVFTACDLLYRVWKTATEPLVLNLPAFIKFLRSPPSGRNGLLTNIDQYVAVYQFAEYLMTNSPYA